MDSKIIINLSKRLILLFLFIHLLLLLSCSNSKSPENIVLEYKDAFNSHNVDSLLSFYSDNVIFNVPDLRMKLTGKNDLRGVGEYDSVLNTIMELSNISSHNDTVYCSIRETNDWMSLSGISSSYYNISIFVIQENNISYIEADLSDSSLHNMREVLGSFIPWAKENYPNSLDSLMPNGNFQFDTKGGIIFLELLKEWHSSIH